MSSTIPPSPAPPSPDTSSHSTSQHPSDTDYDPYEGIDLREMFARLGRGLAQTLGFALLGLAIAIVSYLAASPSWLVTTSTRVMFAFDGYQQRCFFAADKSPCAGEDIDVKVKTGSQYIFAEQPVGFRFFQCVGQCFDR